MTDKSSSENMSSENGSSTPSEGEDRRKFTVEIASIVIGGFLGAFSFLTGLVVFFDPLSRKKKIPRKYAEAQPEGPEGFIRIGPLDALQAGGEPQRFPVIDDIVDAWNFSPAQPIGAVFIKRLEGEELSVYHSTCPHAGCSVSAGTGSKGEFQFQCPCHNSSFDEVGKRVSVEGKDNPSPRDLDTLEYEVHNGDIWIKYVDYYTGIHEKKAKI